MGRGMESKTLGMVLTVRPVWWLRGEVIAGVGVVVIVLWVIFGGVRTRGYRAYSVLLYRVSGQWQLSTYPPPPNSGILDATMRLQTDEGWGWRSVELELMAKGVEWDSEVSQSNRVATAMTPQRAIDAWKAIVQAQRAKATGNEEIEGLEELATAIRAAQAGDSELWHGRAVYVAWSMAQATGWMLIVVGVTLGVGRALRRRTLERRVRAAESGRCPSCGYELGKIDLSDVCPECGDHPRTVRRMSLEELGYVGERMRKPQDKRADTRVGTRRDEERVYPPA